MRWSVPTWAALAALVAAAGCTEDADPVDPGPLPEWSPSPPASEEMARRRDWQVVRGVAHLHSPFSHDACDSLGYEDGVIDEACLADMRRGLCDAGHDFALITDHPAHMNEQAYEALTFARPEDARVDGGLWMTCEDGRGVLLMPGHESGSTMSYGLDAHPEDLGHYDSQSPAALAGLSAAGALVMVAHTEFRSLETLTAMVEAEPGLDGLEIYNVHADIDPRIRAEQLGKESQAVYEALGAFLFRPEAAPHPDLLALAFVGPNEPALERWDALLPEHRLLGLAGTDAHQNAFPGALGDGERGDSYRRMLRWFGNHVLVNRDLRIGGGPGVDARLTPAGLKSALRAGRAAVVFELLGTPLDFDFTIEQAGRVLEMGDEMPLAGEALLRVRRPLVLPARHPEQPLPEIELRLFRVHAGGSELVLRSEVDIELRVAAAGAWRVEVWMTPNHLRPYLGDEPEVYLRPFPWIYSNPIYLR